MLPGIIPDTFADNFQHYGYSLQVFKSVYSVVIIHKNQVQVMISAFKNRSEENKKRKNFHIIFYLFIFFFFYHFNSVYLFYIINCIDLFN